MLRTAGNSELAADCATTQLLDYALYIYCIMYTCAYCLCVVPDAALQSLRERYAEYLNILKNVAFHKFFLNWY
jgi:hypothetical protein